MLRISFYTALALCAFAANSVLCRLALSHGSIDPASFSTVRLMSGALTLLVIVQARSWSGSPAAPSWISAAILFGYAVPFSFAYVSLSTGTGALLLFGAVQVTMLFAAIRRGDRPGPAQWLGLCTAFGGLVWLVLPGVTAPSHGGAGLMLLAGIAWGVYSLRGRGVGDPLGQTASNFLRTVPMALGASLLTLRSFHVTPSGLLLAIVSGSLASGVGYVIWYRALAGLSGVAASVVQLAVPVLAAAAGIVLLGERITLRLGMAGVLVLGGIFLALLARPGGVAPPLKPHVANDP